MQNILYSSWGYDMTIVDYCKIIATTPKKVKCVMISTKVENDNGIGTGRAYPDENKVTSKPFYLKVKGDCFVGSYPFCNDSKRKGYFSKYDGKGNYYNTYD